MSNFTPNHYSAPLTLYHEVLCHQACYVDTALGSLRVVSILEMQGSHTVQPGPSQLRRVAIRLGKTVVKVNQLLVVTLMDLKGERRQGEEKRGRGDKEERRGERGRRGEGIGEGKREGEGRTGRRGEGREEGEKGGGDERERGGGGKGINIRALQPSLQSWLTSIWAVELSTVFSLSINSLTSEGKAVFCGHKTIQHSNLDIVQLENCLFTLTLSSCET